MREVKQKQHADATGDEPASCRTLASGVARAVANWPLVWTGVMLQVAVLRPPAWAATAALHSSSAKERHSTGCRRGPIVSAVVAPPAAAQPSTASSFIDGPPEEDREGWTPCVLTPTVHGDELKGTVRIPVRPPVTCSMTTTAIGPAGP